MREDKINIVFLLYLQRSGSTYLSNELNNYDDILVTIEDSTMLGLPLLEFYHKKEEVYNILRKDKKFKYWNFEDSELKKIIFQNKQKTIFENLIFHYLKKIKPKAKCCIYKMPIDERIIKIIDKNYIDAKFINLVRDPRAIYLSQSVNSISSMESKFTDNVIFFSRQWRNKNLRIENITSESLKEKIYQIRYENLINSSSIELNKLVKFLNCRDKITVKPEKSYIDMIPKNQIRLHPFVGLKAQKDRIDRWKHKLSNNELYLIQKICAQQMKKFDYKALRINKISTITKILLYTKFYLLLLKKIFGFLLKPLSYRTINTFKNQIRRINFL